MRFVETLGWLRLLMLAAAGRPAFYNRLSVTGRAAMRLAGRLGLSVERLRKLEIGYLDSAAGVRSAAYANAEASVECAGCISWAAGLDGALGINFGLIVEKYHFEFLYAKYLFLETVLRYAAEHPEERHDLICEAVFAEPYLDVLAHRKDRIILRLRRGAWLRFWGGLALLPALLVAHARGMRRQRAQRDQLICVVDDSTTQQMFEALFGRDKEILYVVEPHYAAAFVTQVSSAGSLRIAGLSARRWLRLAAILPRYMVTAFLTAGRLMRYGEMPFVVFDLLCKGRALAPEGPGNVLVTFEHLTLARSIRNEYLRAEGSVSIYVPKNSYVTYQQYPAEWKLNYDVFCAPGPHAEELYGRKRALTGRFPRTGSYDAHRPLADLEEAHQERLEDLLAFKGSDRLVTVLTPGICDETLSSERRLLGLAGRLSLLPGVRVLVRRKPVPPELKYRTFYEDQLAPYAKIRLTSGEFDLFDFVGPTDIFVTSISTSACDVASRGGTALFIDFMGTPSIYLPLEKVPEMVSTGAEAYDKITGWLMDRENGPVRSTHRSAMGRFVDCVGYRFSSFDAYRSNLLAELRPWLTPLRRSH